MIREVRVAAAVYEQAHEQFGESRSVDGAPSQYDFGAGPLAAATFAFRDFDKLAYSFVPAVRTYTIVDPFFGPVVFVGVLLTDGAVRSSFSDDPDYWTASADDPE